MNLPTMNAKTPSTEATPATAANNQVAVDVDIATLLAEPAPLAWYRRPVLWVAVALLIMLVAGFWYWQAQRAAKALPSYTTQEAAQQYN